MINKSIVLTEYNGKRVCFLSVAGRIEAIEMAESPGNTEIGNIYIGRISKIISGIQGAFVNISREQQCFMQLHRLDRINILNRKADGTIRVGDELIVKLIKAPYDNKKAVVTGCFNVDRELLDRAKSRSLYSCLYAEKSDFAKFTSRFLPADRIVTDLEEEYIKLIEEVRGTSLPEYYSDDYPLSKLYKLESLFEELKNTRIWLPSGGNILIETTKAFNVIDVNSSKSVKDSRELFLKTNMEAGAEALRQIRLRNLSGILLIDFINTDEEHEKQLLEYMTKLAKEETEFTGITTKVIDITGLGIMELTRKRERPPLEVL